MGANMQRQAVPLLTTEAPIVATGQEHKNCIDSGVVILAEGGGEVTKDVYKRQVQAGAGGTSAEAVEIADVKGNGAVSVHGVHNIVSGPAYGDLNGAGEDVYKRQVSTP